MTIGLHGLMKKRCALKGQPDAQEYFLVSAEAGDITDDSGYEFLTGWFYAHPSAEAPETGWFQCDETGLVIKIGKGISSGSWKEEEEFLEEIQEECGA